MNPNEHDLNRTKAFHVEKKIRRGDSIAWIVTSVIFFFLIVIAVGRITVVGQFIDDIVFTFLFGWFKYMMYLIFIGINLCIYFGIRFKFKKRFLLMVLGSWCAVSWIISAVLFITAYHMNISSLAINHYFSKKIFSDSINAYVTNWKHFSVFGDFKPHSWILSNSHTYFSLWAGGGFIGAFLSGIFSYTTIYGNLVFALFSLFLVGVWVFTGDIFYLFKPRNRRHGRKLRILSLGTAKMVNNKVQKIKASKGKKSVFQIDYYDNAANELDIVNSQTFADITIEMPGFKKSYDSKSGGEITDAFSSYADNGVQNRRIPFGGTSYVEDDFVQPGVDYGMPVDYGFNHNNPYDHRYQPPMTSQNYEPQQNNAGYFAPQQAPVNPYYNAGVNYEDNEPDFPAPKYGNGSVEEARKILERETSVTPFGANGKTLEIFKKDQENATGSSQETKHSKKTNDNHDGQMTIEDFINNEANHIKEPTIPIYDSPLKRRVARSNHDNFDFPDTKTAITIPHSTEKAKTVMPVVINKNYRLPNIDLLNPDKVDLNLQAKMKEAAIANSKIINSVFESFNTKAQVTEYLIGPAITQFIVSLDPGSKVQSVLNLENEIKLRLATQNVLMQAPISGKAAVGIEIPNPSVMPVYYRGVISQVPLQKANSKLFFPIGKNVVGNVIFGDLSSMPHLLVAGSTGSGKSVMINSIITSILLRAKPHEVKMLMVDPKRVELLPYANIPHLIAPIISNMALAAAALKKIVFEMERRYGLFSGLGVKNINGYNEMAKKEEDKLPYIVVIIDELADLMLTENKKAVEEAIMRLTQMARAAGIHVIVATQRPSTDVITGVIKANIPSRISFAVANQYDSRTILDNVGAEKLVGKGDMLFMEPGQQKPVRAQGIYVADDEIQRITQFCANQQEPNFDPTFLEAEAATDGRGGSGDRDEMYDQAIELIAASGQASTSYLQRKLRIGYNRASRIIDQLEEDGLIGPQNGAKSRDIYINRE